MNAAGTVQYMQDVNAGGKRPKIDYVITDDVTPYRPVTRKLAAFACFGMIGKQLKNSLDFF